MSMFDTVLRVDGIPSHDAFRRVFVMLGAEAFKRCFGMKVEIDAKRKRAGWDEMYLVQNPISTRFDCPAPFHQGKRI